MIGINLLALVLSQADKVALSNMLPLATFGFYTLAVTVCSIIVAATGPISQAIYPVLIRHNASGDQTAFNRSYHFAAQFVSVAAATIACPLILFPYQVVFAWSADAALAANVAPLLRLLAAGTLCNALMQIPYFALLALGRTRFALVLNAVAVALIVPALLIEVPLHGAIAAASIWLALNVGMLAIGTPMLHKRYLPGQLFEWTTKDVLAPLAASIGVAMLLHLILPTSPAGRITWLVFLGAATTAIGVAALLASNIVRRIVVDALVALIPARS